MPRPAHKPRKRYVPKRVDLDPFDLAASRAALLLPQQRMSLLVPVYRAFQAFREGRGDLDLWRDLADAMNVAEVLCELNIAPDHVGVFQAAQAALADVHERAVQRHRYTLYGHEITALDDAVEMHRIQLDYCSQGELARAIDTVKRRVQQALAGNASPRAHVCTPGLLGREPAVPPQPH
jgi:hypothetical protein